MGKIWIPGGGDGADLDVITAAESDVRKGKMIVDKDGNPLTGIMAEIAAKTYTPGTSNQVIAANQFLAGAQTIKGDGNLNANNIVYGKLVFRVIILFMEEHFWRFRKCAEVCEYNKNPYIIYR